MGFARGGPGKTSTFPALRVGGTGRVGHGDSLARSAGRVLGLVG